ncbi:MAG: sigma-70 family RNA polymerase sigma factor [Planctomycetota bacterium]
MMPSHPDDHAKPPASPPLVTPSSADGSATGPSAPPEVPSSQADSDDASDRGATFDEELGQGSAGTGDAGEGDGAGTPDPDAATLAAAVDGDDSAFEELVRRHQDRVYTNIYFMVHDRELAADLSQECFLRAYRGLRSFQGRSLFATWLKRIAVNVTLHHFEKARAQKRTATVISISQERSDGEESQLQIAAQGRSPDEVLEDRERRTAIEDAVAELEPEYRTALALRELHGYSYREITEVLNLPIGTVKSKIFRARQILQEKLKDLI